MKRLSALLLLACLALPAAAADKLDGVLTLVKDDVTALAQVKATPARHVMLYFGDYAN